MNNLFILFIFVVIFAFAVIPILAVKGGDNSASDAAGGGKRNAGKKNKDRVSAKVSSVRKSAGEKDADFMGIIEFNTENGSDKGNVVDEDIDSFIVTGSLEGRHVTGFDYSNKKDCVYHDCRMIKKSDVTAYYKEYTETKYFYKDRPVQISERDGQTFAEVYEGPASFISEFS